MKICKLILLALLFVSIPGLKAQRQLMTNAGAYSAATTYAQSDVVFSVDAYYISLIANNLNNTPASNPSSWRQIGGSSPTGAAGGALSGNYPNPGLQASSVVSAINGQPITPSSVAASTAILTNVEYSLGTCTTAKTIDPANGTRQKVTLTNGQTCALTFTQPASGTASVTLKITQSAVSSYNGAISGCKWPGGVTPTITATSGAVDFVSVYLDGSTAYCVASQNFQ